MFPASIDPRIIVHYFSFWTGVLLTGCRQKRGPVSQDRGEPPTEGAAESLDPGFGLREICRPRFATLRFSRSLCMTYAHKPPALGRSDFSARNATILPQNNGEYLQQAIINRFYVVFVECFKIKISLQTAIVL